MQFRACKILVAGVLAVFAAAIPVSAQQYNQKLFSEMRWRCIGPFRGGRTVAITGVPHQPNVFYMAAVNGGVWKTTDFGHTWEPIFDEQDTGSVGASVLLIKNWLPGMSKIRGLPDAAVHRSHVENVRLVRHTSDSDSPSAAEGADTAPAHLRKKLLVILLPERGYR